MRRITTAGVLAGAMVALLVAGGLESIPADAGEFDRSFSSLPAEIDVENPGPPVTPTIYVVGIPDRSADPVRKTKGVALNGLRLSEDLLSESVLILRPDGTGRWGYHTGFDIFREPQFEDGRRIDPRILVEYDKWRFDPLFPVRRVGGDMNLLRLFDRRPLPAVYRVAFGPSMRIRTFRVSSNCDVLGREDVIVRVRLYADAGRQQLVAEQAVGQGQSAVRFPVEFPDLDRELVFLELTAEAPTDVAVDLYYTLFEAELDTRQLAMPKLNTGANRLVVQDDPDSSHRVRIVLRWEERPPPDHIWDDFEDRLQWGGCTSVEGSFEEGLPFTGRRFARATFPANGRDFALNRSLPGIDLSSHNRIGVATRVIRGAPMRATLLGIKNHDTAYQYVRPRFGADWNFQSFDISCFRRDQVVAMNLYWMVQPGFDRPDDPCVYDVDTLCFWHEDAPSAPAKALPDPIARYVAPDEDLDRPPIPRYVPPIQDWFPMGIYDGICGRSEQECRWLFDQMRRLHMNAVYVSNGTIEGLERILPLAEARGIRLIYQGSGEGSLYYEHLATPQARRQSLERVILPRAAKAIPTLADRWGVAAWSLTEEIGPELSRELSDYYQLVRQLAPEQPPTVLHNNLQAALADLETNGPLVVTHDFYPFFWSPRSGPSNPGRSVPYYRQRVRSYYEACRKHGASLWMMPQAWGTAETAPLAPPHYGYRGGMRTPEPGEIKLQGWVAVAEGATGIMFYAALATSPGERQLWDADWTETDNTRAAGELFKRLSRIAPVLCRLQREAGEADFVTSSNPRVLAHRFVKRTPHQSTAQYVVYASLDGFGSQSFDLTIQHGEHRVYDLVTRQDVTDSLVRCPLAPQGRGQGEGAESASVVCRTVLNGIELPAGEGGLLLVGTPADFEADCRLIDADPSAKSLASSCFPP